VALKLALEVLAPLERSRPGASEGRAGYAAYRLRALDEARALWAGDGGLADRQFGEDYARLLKALPTLAARRDSGRGR